MRPNSRRLVGLLVAMINIIVLACKADSCIDLTQGCSLCPSTFPEFRFISPIERTDDDGSPIYVLEYASEDGENTTFTCIAEDAGRISGLSLGNDSLLVSADTAEATGFPGLYGSAFWVSPQASWSWPPPPAFDTETYDVTVDEEAMSVEFSGPFDATLGLRLVKLFTLDLSRGAIRLKHSITRDDNSFTGTAIAPWEITRVGPGGITFFPTDSAAMSESGGGFAPVPITTAVDATWFAHDPSSVDPGGEKLFTAGCGGWIGHAIPLSSEAGSKDIDGDDERDSAVLVKVCEAPPSPGSSACDTESSLELYAVPDYEEVECQGGCSLLAPGNTREWNCIWYTRRVPYSDCLANQELVVYSDCLANCPMGAG